MAVTTAQFLLTPTRVLIVEGVAGPVEVHLQGDGDGEAYIGGADVTVANGYPMSSSPVLTFTLDANDDLYAVLGSGTTYRLFVFVT